MSKVMVIQLFHGRQRPDEELEDWGADGPKLRVLYVHTTYMAVTYIGYPALEYPSGADSIDLDAWTLGQRDGVIVDDLFHYNGMFYGDWSVCMVDEAEVTGDFDPALAVFPLDKDWQDIPKDPKRVYK